MAVVFSNDLVLAAQQGVVQPLTHARIMYNNLVPGGTVTGSTETAGFEADAVQSYDTYDRWLPSAIPATLTFDLGSIQDIDYIFIASHNLGSTGSAFVGETSPDAITWTEAVPERIPGDDSAIALLFEEVSVRYFRIRITSSLSIPRIGVVMSGIALAMQRPIYGGHSPINLSRQSEIRPTKSEGGQWLGRSVVRRGFATDYNWQHLTADWYREFFDPFVRQARFQPFGIAWRPETYPEEVAYVWTENDIQPSNMGIRNYMQVDLTVTGYDSGDL